MLNKNTLHHQRKSTYNIYQHLPQSWIIFLVNSVDCTFVFPGHVHPYVRRQLRVIVASIL